MSVASAFPPSSIALPLNRLAVAFGSNLSGIGSAYKTTFLFLSSAGTGSSCLRVTLWHDQVVNAIEAGAEGLIEVPRQDERVGGVGDHLNFRLIRASEEDNLSFRVKLVNMVRGNTSSFPREHSVYEYVAS